ncbi:hypothetical protein AciX9_4617 (plasmid) [Granulicella tundricola MP5ACTX9]|uniref:DUF2846 domain-containing protein n=1 Tax=Granulicella tundricola (strain ATCC BAA-1859 / DSM 23138 / MP5ACTX9) TaxID=1198114 RepID=E8X7W3_GRATM|nr:hypothetical protein AciX9_4617 [Granulicella tundricola MP5ACTX9]
MGLDSCWLCVLNFSILAAIPALAQGSPVAPPPAQVTFYSHGVTMLGGLPGHDPAAFKGRIFDADHQLAFMEPSHFITFNMAPGLHTLSATWWTAKHSNSGAHITLNLVGGEQYFIETMVLNSGFMFGSVSLKIREVTCEGARRDNTHSKPLEATHLRPDGVPIALLSTTFPQCP